MSERSGRILGLDYGSKTVGVAVCDPLRVTVRGLEIIRRKDETHLRPTLRRIAELAREYDVDAVVLGLPLNMDDSEGLRAQKTLEFRKMLESRLSVPVIMQD
ncbi:MAG: Holliday junction resolvase RuvX, partial [Lachnospiraceae bacterium]|nr:Holliday junction resolvase RuvX [Lachnospiraceae bacterium]